MKIIPSFSIAEWKDFKWWTMDKRGLKTIHFFDLYVAKKGNYNDILIFGMILGPIRIQLGFMWKQSEYNRAMEAMPPHCKIITNSVIDQDCFIWDKSGVFVGGSNIKEHIGKDTDLFTCVIKETRDKAEGFLDYVFKKEEILP